MIFHAYYSNVPRAQLDAFVQAQELGRLVTVGGDGVPHVGLYPFVFDGAAVDLHLVAADEQVADLEERPACVFEVDEVLGVIPSYWVHAEYAGSAAASSPRRRRSPRSSDVCSHAINPKAATGRSTRAIRCTAAPSGGSPR